MQVIQRSITDVRKSGSSETAETSVQRPSVNGSMETVEKHTVVTSKQGGANYQQEATTYQRDGSGNFALQVKQSVEHIQEGGMTTENAARYEVTDGRLQLHSQTVSKVVARPDGSKEAEVTLFAPNTLGTVDSGSPKLKLREQQVIEKRPGPGGTVVETVSVRRPSQTDQTVFGPMKQVSERICRTTRTELAPRAVRIAISFCRARVLTKTRLATLAHAISSTNPTAPSKTSKAGRTSPTS